MVEDLGAGLHDNQSFYEKDCVDTSLLFFFLILVVLFNSCEFFCDRDDDTLLFFFLLLVLLFNGGWCC